MRSRLVYLTALGLSGVACNGDDTPIDPTTAGDTTMETEPTTSVTTTVTVGDTEPTMGSVDSSSGGEPSGGGPTCGDDVAEGDEACDGTDLAGADCIDQGFDGGELSCAADCSGFDTSGCTTGSCGDELLEGTEVCDGADLGGEDCISQGFDGGELSCAADCSDFDPSGCTVSSCGNELLEGMETCDGSDLGGQDCASIGMGFDAGTLGCDPGCMAYDTSGCIAFACGNELLEGTEACDGAALGGASCATEGYVSGVLGCAPDCSTYDTTGCICVAEEDVGSASGPAVTTGSTVGEDDTLPLSCGAGGGADHVIGFTAPIAGDYTFDTLGSAYDTAVGVFSSCSAGAEIACNDDSVGLLSEVTVDLAAGQTVFVAIDGFLGATGDWVLNVSLPPADVGCNEEDVGSTFGTPVTMGSTVGEDDTLGQSCGMGAGGADHVVLFTAPFAADYVFDTLGSGYNTTLAAFGECPGPELACNDDVGGGVVQSELVLPLSAGQSVLMAVGGFNGATGDWVLDINPVLPPAPMCTEEDIATSVGANVATGSTVGEDENLAQSCAGGGAVDHVIRFVAPTTATFVLDTFGSAYDTALSLHDDCGLPSVMCNDDAGGVLQSELQVDLVGGQQVLIAVSGYNGATGNWILNITQL